MPFPPLGFRFRGFPMSCPPFPGAPPRYSKKTSMPPTFAEAPDFRVRNPRPRVRGLGVQGERREFEKRCGGVGSI